MAGDASAGSDCVRDRISSSVGAASALIAARAATPKQSAPNFARRENRCMRNTPRRTVRRSGGRLPEWGIGVKRGWWAHAFLSREGPETRFRKHAPTRMCENSVGLQEICGMCYYGSAIEGLPKILAWRGGRVGCAYSAQRVQEYPGNTRSSPNEIWRGGRVV